jgi:hypothetical protein
MARFEQCEFPGSMIQLQSNADGPDLSQLQRGFWPSSLHLFRIARLAVVVEVFMSGSSFEGRSIMLTPISWRFDA